MQFVVKKSIFTRCFATPATVLAYSDCFDYVADGLRYCFGGEVDALRHWCDSVVDGLMHYEGRGESDDKFIEKYEKLI